MDILNIGKYLFTFAMTSYRERFGNADIKRCWIKMRTLRKKIRLVVEKTDTGFSAYCKDYPVYTTGQTFTELLRHGLEALNLYLSEQGIAVTSYNIEFEIDIPQFFQYYRVINSKFLARRIGMNESLLSQYVHDIKKPSAAQTNRILAGIREIGQELSSLNFQTG